jgi:hypothetical protein
VKAKPKRKPQTSAKRRPDISRPREYIVIMHHKSHPISSREAKQLLAEAMSEPVTKDR